MRNICRKYSNSVTYIILRDVFVCPWAYNISILYFSMNGLRAESSISSLQKKGEYLDIEKLNVVVDIK